MHTKKFWSGFISSFKDIDFHLYSTFHPIQVLSAILALSSARLVIYPNGAVVPANTPAVAAAKLAHHNAGGAIAYHLAAPNLAVVIDSGEALVAHANGAVVPLDTPEVVAARAAHLAAGGAVQAPGVLKHGHPNGPVVPA